MNDGNATSRNAPVPTPLCGGALPEASAVPVGTVARLMQVPWTDEGGYREITFPTRIVREREVLARAGDPWTALYVVRSGCFKTTFTDACGAMQGIGFPMAGDVIGADGLAEGRYTTDAVALDRSDVVVIGATRISQLSLASPALARLVYRMMGREIVREHATLFMLGSLPAEGRVAAFLLNLSARMGAMGYSRRTLLLRMTRQDIANHLGMTIETVSRTLSALANTGVIDVRHRRVEILDPACLQRLAHERPAEPLHTFRRPQPMEHVSARLPRAAESGV